MAILRVSKSHHVYKWALPLKPCCTPRLFACLVFNGTFSTIRLHRAIEVRSISRRAGAQYHASKQRKNTINQDNQTLFGLGFMEMIPSLRLGFLRGVFLGNRLASNDDLTRTTLKTEHIQTKANNR